MKKYVLGLIFIILCAQSCAIKRCKGRQCTVRMVHYHGGDEYRGVNLFTYLFKNKNPRYGWSYPNLVKDPNGIDDSDKNVYDKKSKANLKVIKPKPPKEEKPEEEKPQDKETKAVESTESVPVK